MNEQREKPILFSAPMVRAILAGTKCQTRRVVKPQPVADAGWDGGAVQHTKKRSVSIAALQRGHVLDSCPFGVPGDRLWVRETWNYTHEMTDAEQTIQDEILRQFQRGEIKDVVAGAMALPVGTGPKRALYAADFGEWAHSPDSDLHWRPSIHMPRWASRITLEITDVRVQRVQEISEEDALAEGVPTADDRPNEDRNTCPKCHGVGLYEAGSLEGAVEVDCLECDTAVKRFGHLWNSINEKRGFGWAANPWVWCVGFQRVPQQDQRDRRRAGVQATT